MKLFFPNPQVALRSKPPFHHQVIVNYQMKLITLLVQELFHEALFLAVDFTKISGICWFGLLVYFFSFLF